MRFLSLCSGIEAASVAWAPLGWSAAAFAEIEAFPSAVLAHHYPSVPNLGDMTRFQEWPDLGSIDLVCGGTPCQSFSNAGLRKGLDDPRGNLMLTFGAIVAAHRPKWVVFENVPGLLSSGAGRDFAGFLGLLSGQSIEPPVGGWQSAGVVAGIPDAYGLAWRVLDAQFVRVDGYARAVPQRRQRVFVVGCLGDWRSAAAVLLERESLRGDSAPRRVSGARVAATLTRGAESSGRGGYAGRRQEDDTNIVVADTAPTIDASYGRLQGANGQDANHGHAHLIAYGGNNTRGPISVSSALSAHGGTGRHDFESETFIAHTLRGDGFDASEDGTGRGTPLVPVPFDTTQITSASNYSNPKPGDPCHPLVAGGHAPAVAFGWQNAAAQGMPVDTIAPTLDKSKHPATATATAVRRLMPVECERLQGFPDGYTAVLHRSKPAADAPRYKAIGNSWAIPPVRWIGMRIAMVDSLRVRALEAA